MPTIMGNCTIEFLAGANAKQMGTVRLEYGRVSGSDIRNVQYTGTYREEPATGDILIECKMIIPPKTQLTRAVESLATPVQLPASWRIPASALNGSPVALSVPLNQAHECADKIGEARVRFTATARAWQVEKFAWQVLVSPTLPALRPIRCNLDRQSIVPSRQPSSLYFSGSKLRLI